MDTTYIEKQINILDKGIEWGKSYISDPGESQEYHRRLVNIRREMSKIKDALSERCAAATYGESQMGKSYLVNAMFSEPSLSFCIKNGEESYDFKKEINPSEPNSQIEATGVVTRFTHKAIELPQGVPSSYLRAQLLSVADLVMIICESYYNGVDYEFRTTVIKSQLSFEDFEGIGEVIKGAKRYYLQKFIPSKCLNEALMGEKSYSDEELKTICDNLKKYVNKVEFR